MSSTARAARRKKRQDLGWRDRWRETKRRVLSVLFMTLKEKNTFLPFCLMDVFFGGGFGRF